jgi:serine/threonine protein kinase
MRLNSRLLQDYFNATAMGDTASSTSESFFNRVGIYIVGFGCAIVLIVAISVVAVLYLRYKRRMAAVSPYWRQGMSGQLQGVLETTVPLLARDEVETACEDFSNIIDASPDSVVYKGTLSNGTEIAALSLQSGATWEPHKELSFRNTVKALARMEHPHLVNLIGYCSQDEPWTRIFIFEYASNGTLYDHLHNKESEHLTWAARMRVIVGAAHGLTYMHHEISPHVSFGAEAVYLTDDYAAKVSNAAATKLPAPRTDPKPSWFSLKSEAGSSSNSQELGFDSNVYSFGVFLLEAITGRPLQDEQGASIVDWAAEYLGDPKMMWYMVDPSLKSHNHDELVALCKVVNMCLVHSPSMAQVTEVLTDVLRLSPEMVAPKSTAALWAQLELQDDSASASSEMST